MVRTLPLLLLTTSCAALCTGSEPERARVDPDALLVHVDRLADDDLAGRLTGSAGARRAADYLADELADLGVRPFDASGYVDGFAVYQVEELEAPRVELECPAGRRRLVNGLDYQLAAYRGSAGGVGLVIHRIDSPGALPPPSPSIALVAEHDSNLAFWLDEAGHPYGAGYGAIVYLFDDVKAFGASDLNLRAPWASHAGHPCVVRFFGAASRSVRSGAARFLNLWPGAYLDRRPSGNVAGVLPGTDLAHELVVLSAHYDHIGSGELPGNPDCPPPRQGDEVFNGANDDASGCAALLEVARVLASGPRPRRSVVFLFCTAEELGLWGSEYWCRSLSPVQSERIVANLNLEMLGLPKDELGTLCLTDLEDSGLGAALLDGGIRVVADDGSLYEDDLASSTDSATFRDRGVPIAHTLSSGDMHTPHYHCEGDELATLDRGHLARAAEVALFAARWLANPVD